MGNEKLRELLEEGVRILWGFREKEYPRTVQWREKAKAALAAEPPEREHILYCEHGWPLPFDRCPKCPVAQPATEQPSASQFDARAECGYCHRALGRHEECYCDEYVRSAVRAAIPRTIHSDSLFDNMVELVKAAYAAGKREGQQ